MRRLAKLIWYGASNPRSKPVHYGFVSIFSGEEIYVNGKEFIHEDYFFNPKDHTYFTMEVAQGNSGKKFGKAIKVYDELDKDYLQQFISLEHKKALAFIKEEVAFLKENNLNRDVSEISKFILFNKGIAQLEGDLYILKPINRLNVQQRELMQLLKDYVMIKNIEVIAVSSGRKLTLSYIHTFDEHTIWDGIINRIDKEFRDKRENYLDDQKYKLTSNGTLLSNSNAVEQNLYKIKKSLYTRIQSIQKLKQGSYAEAVSLIEEAQKHAEVNDRQMNFFSASTNQNLIESEMYKLASQNWRSPSGIQLFTYFQPLLNAYIQANKREHANKLEKFINPNHDLLTLQDYIYYHIKNISIYESYSPTYKRNVEKKLKNMSINDEINFLKREGKIVLSQNLSDKKGYDIHQFAQLLSSIAKRFETLHQPSEALPYYRKLKVYYEQVYEFTPSQESRRRAFYDDREISYNYYISILERIEQISRV